MTENSPLILLEGMLKEEGETFTLPYVENGEMKDYARIRLEVYRKGKEKYEAPENLLYVTLPPGTSLELGEYENSAPFTLATGEFAVARIKKGRPYKVRLPRDGTRYHTIEMLREFESELFDEGIEKWERREKLFILPGATVYPESCAQKIPGWIAGWWNGSPELHFAYSKYEGPRKEEKTHSHRKIIEPYMGISGEGRLLVRIGKREEILPLNEGKIIIPGPGIPHKLVFNDVKFPFTLYVLNYSATGKPGNRSGITSRRTF